MLNVSVRTPLLVVADSSVGWLHASSSSLVWRLGFLTIESTCKNSSAVLASFSFEKVLQPVTIDRPWKDACSRIICVVFKEIKITPFD